MKENKHQGGTNKRKGSNAERYYASVFRNMHSDFSKCLTSRQASQLLDSCKVDLVHIPLLVQVKAGKQRGMVPSAVLREMDEMLKRHIPETDQLHSYPKIVIHRMEVGRGKQRDTYSDMVSMTFDDFKDIFLAAYTAGTKSRKRK